jgi:hypothetical protein
MGILLQSNRSLQPPLNSDQLSITAPILWSQIGILLHKIPLNNDHQSTTTTNLWSQGWSLFTGLTVHVIDFSNYTWKSNADAGDNIPVKYIFRFSNGQAVDEENPEGNTELHARPKGTLFFQLHQHFMISIFCQLSFS